MVTLVGVGDIMLGRGVAESAAPDAACLLMPALRELMHGDLVTGNLECLVSTRGAPSRFSHSHFRTRPEFAEPLLRMFDVVTLANNHVFDFGLDAITDTIMFLERIGVRHVGIGASAAEAVRPARFARGGMTVDVFGASDVTNIADGWSGIHVASVDALLLAAVARSKAEGAVVVVHLHAGGGDVELPSPRVYGLHEKLRAAGADVVLGHHPHRVQGWLERGNAIGFFSLGDFIFDKFDNGRESSLVARIDLRTMSAKMAVAHRLADLRVDIAPPEAGEVQMQALRAVSSRIREGAVGALHRSHSLASYKARLVSLGRDYRAGGLGTVFARMRNKLRKLRS